MMLLMTLIGNRISEYKQTIADQEEWIDTYEQIVARNTQAIFDLHATIKALEEVNKELRDELQSGV